MNLESIFLREHDGSQCGSGMCAKDERCDDSNCPGHPIRTRRIQEADLRWTNEVGVESALPPAFTAPPPKPAREPIDWQLVAIWCAVAVCFLWVAILSAWR